MTGRKVALGMNMSLDGYVFGPAGEGDVEELFVTMDDEVNDYFVESLQDIDTMLMGRVNYLEQAAYWPTATDALAPIVNAHEKRSSSPRRWKASTGATPGWRPPVRPRRSRT